MGQSSTPPKAPSPPKPAGFLEGFQGILHGSPAPVQTNFQKVVHDPRFYEISPGEQQDLLNHVDFRFASMGDDAQKQMVGVFNSEWRKAHPPLTRRLVEAVAGPGTMIGEIRKEAAEPKPPSVRGSLKDDLKESLKEAALSALGPIAVYGDIHKIVEQPIVRPGVLVNQTGMLKGAAEFAGGLTSPENLALMFFTGPGTVAKDLLGEYGAMAMNRAMDLWFGGKMVGAARDYAKKFKEAYNKGDRAAAEQYLTEFIGSVGMAAYAVSGGAKEAARKRSAREAAEGMRTPKERGLLQAPTIDIEARRVETPVEPQAESAPTAEEPPRAPKPPVVAEDIFFTSGPKVKETERGREVSFNVKRRSDGRSMGRAEVDIPNEGSPVIKSKPQGVSDEEIIARAIGKAGKVQNPKPAPAPSAPMIAAKPVVPRETSSPAAEVAAPRGGAELLPKDLRGSKPRYGYRDRNFKLDFESEADKALYTAAQTTKNKAHDRFMEFLRPLFPGETDQQIIRRGKAVRERIKKLAAEAPSGETSLSIPTSQPTSAPVAPVIPPPAAATVALAKQKIAPAAQAPKEPSPAPAKSAAPQSVEAMPPGSRVYFWNLPEADRSMTGPWEKLPNGTWRHGQHGAVVSDEAVASTIQNSPQTHQITAPQGEHEEPLEIGAHPLTLEERPVETFAEPEGKTIDVVDNLETAPVVQLPVAEGIEAPSENTLQPSAEIRHIRTPKRVSVESIPKPEPAKDSQGIEVASPKPENAPEAVPSVPEEAGASTPLPEAVTQAPGPSAPQPEPKETPAAQTQPTVVVKAEKPAPRQQVAVTALPDYHITEADGIGTLTPMARALANIMAIKTLKQIEGSGKPATLEQQEILAKYTGWGGLPMTAFYSDYRETAGWKRVREEMQQHLTRNEIDQARAATLNAFYTSPAVIRGIYAGLHKAGVNAEVINHARLFEPGMGVGHFWGLMPKELAVRIAKVGVELDPTSAKVAKHLYPSGRVLNQPFESVKMPQGYFDLALGNVPFGSESPFDPAYRQLHAPLHDYFIIKTLDLVRPGGVVAVITSRGTLDKQLSAFRKEMLKRADLLAAVRLPSAAFEKNAGTRVTTDLLVFKRRAPGTASKNSDWIESTPHETADGEMNLNAHFQDKPQMMLGEMRLTGSMYGQNEPELVGESEGLEERIAAALASALPVDAYLPKKDTVEEIDPAELVDMMAKKKAWSYEIRSGKVVQITPQGVKAQSLSKDQVAKVRDLLAIRDALKESLDAQLRDEPESVRLRAREKLNRLYDAFHKKHGAINKPSNIGVINDDPEAPLLRSLETAEDLAKSDIFTQDTVAPRRQLEHTDDPKQAMLASLADKGRIDWPTMERLTGCSRLQLQSDLAGNIYEDPEKGWVPAEEYLSGNVRKKLAAANAAAEIDGKFRANVEALARVIPEDIPYDQISLRLGTPWIPDGYISGFLQTIYPPPYRFRAAYTESLSSWKIDVANRQSGLPDTTLDSGEFSALQMVEMALNQRRPNVYKAVFDGETRKKVLDRAATEAAREKQDQIQERFARWIYREAERGNHIQRIYNDTFNALVRRKYDGQHLTFPGMNPGIDLRPHQKDFVWRSLNEPNSLNGHKVGAGKTYSGIASIMEKKRLGILKKAMVVTPNHLTGQWAASFQTAYPAARVLSFAPEDLIATKRKVAMSRIATGDWDAIIVPVSSFGLLPVSTKTYREWVEEQLAPIEMALHELKTSGKVTRRQVKELERAKKGLLAKLEKMASRDAKDTTITFEELGIDGLYVDESHFFKNLYFSTKMGDIAGVSSHQTSRAIDMLLKVRHVQQGNNGGGVVFLTGTPLVNSLEEVFTLQRFLDPQGLKEAGMEHFDAWAGTFAEAITAQELNVAASNYRSKTRLARFRNAPELSMMFNKFADIKLSEGLPYLKVPKVAAGKPQPLTSDPSPELKALIQYLGYRMDVIQGKVPGVPRPDPSVDNALKISTEGKKAAIDMRIVDGGAPENPVGKLAIAAERMAKIFHETEPEKSTQIAFLDLSVAPPKSERDGYKGFNAYLYLKRKMEEAGVPEDQILFVQDFDNPVAKAKMFDDVNAGRKRILIGSTNKMGTGMNVQKKMIALHHIDVPWTPADIEQREGRVIRQGNENDVVRILVYVTKGSFDTFMWQTQQRKAEFTAQFLKGELTERTIDNIDGSALTAAEIKALSSDDPRIVKKITTDNRLEYLSRKKGQQQLEVMRAEIEVSKLTGEISGAEKAIADMREDYAAISAATPEKFEIVINGKRFSKREEAGEALLKLRNDLSLYNDGAYRIGEYAGHELRARVLRMRGSVFLDAGLAGKSGREYPFQINSESALGSIRSIEMSPDRIPAEIARKEESIKSNRISLAANQELAASKFADEDEFRQLQVVKEQLDNELGIGKDEAVSEEEPNSNDDLPEAREPEGEEPCP